MGHDGSQPHSQNPPLHPILSQIKSIHLFTPYLSKINFNIILPSTYRSLNWSPSLRFSEFLMPHTCYIPCQFQPHWFKHPDISHHKAKAVLPMQPSSMPLIFKFAWPLRCEHSWHYININTTCCLKIRDNFMQIWRSRAKPSLGSIFTLSF